MGLTARREGLLAATRCSEAGLGVGRTWPRRWRSSRLCGKPRPDRSGRESQCVDEGGGQKTAANALLSAGCTA